MKPVIPREITTEQVESQSKVLGANLMNTHTIQIVLPSNPIDIALVKKCKTVDVPSIHTTVGIIQKYLQKYINFPGMDSVYCDNVVSGNHKNVH